MRPSQASLVLVRFAGRVGRDRSGTKLAHAPCGGDGGDAIELGRCTSSRRANLPERSVEQSSSRDGSDAVGSHDGDDFSLARAEVGHQVCGPREAVPQLQPVKRVDAAGGMSKRGVELDPYPRAETREVPAFAVSPASVIDRKPERSE